MQIDSAKYPRAARYVQNLPNGLSSYPDCMVKANGRESLQRQFSHLADDKNLPSIIRSFLSNNYHDTWLPETVSIATMLMARDTHFKTDAEAIDWAYQDSMSVIKKPMYRMLMFIMSPTLITLGAASRWSTFRKGSYLKTSPVRQENGRLITELNLTFPPNLFEKLTLTQFSQIFVVSLEASGAKNLDVKTTATGITDAHYVASWDR